MNQAQIQLIPIAEINIPNPRPRNKLIFDLIVANIGAVGLKRPITVCPRQAQGHDNALKYDLVCGQGRLEACLALGGTHIPALVIEASREQQFLMSLVENIARRPPSNRDLLREIRALTSRGYKSAKIAEKLGLDRTYIWGIVKLLDHGEVSLIEAVEARRLPISIATVIARGSRDDVRRALSKAYEDGDLRGAKLAEARRIITQRLARQNGSTKRPLHKRRKISSKALLREYRRQVDKNRALVNKAAVTSQRLLLLVSILRRLFADENFVTLLRAERLVTMPEWLAAQLKPKETCSERTTIA